MSAFSIIFTVAGWCFGAINAIENIQCTPSQQFKDSVKFHQCKTEARRRLAERPPPYIESRFSKADASSVLPFCDYLYELETECLPLYSSACHPGKSWQVLQMMWVRQELEQSLAVLPRDQYFHCNTTQNMIHPNEIAAMKEMIKQRDWVGNSRFCRFLLSYKVTSSPNFWLYSIMRCDGRCDPKGVLEDPFRVSPDIFNPPREYRKKVRVVDFKDDDYLTPAMNDTIVKYETCLANLGYPHDVQSYVLNETSPQTNFQHKIIQDQLQTRSCSVITSYVHDCQPLLSRCLSTSNIETIRTQDASWLVSELNTVMNKINIEFNFTNCDVVGGEVSSSPVLIISNIILTFVIIASMIILLFD